MTSSSVYRLEPQSPQKKCLLILPESPRTSYVLGVPVCVCACACVSRTEPVLHVLPVFFSVSLLYFLLPPPCVCVCVKRGVQGMRDAIGGVRGVNVLLVMLSAGRG